MLSRASSDAGTRLRHAKSTSSVHSRGRSAAAGPSDPFIVREHATTAAVQAFERANALDRAKHRPEQSLELARRRSNASRASQGSHFPTRGSSLRQAGEDSAARRRQSTQPQRISLDREQNSKPNATAALAATPKHTIAESIPTSIASAPPISRDMIPAASPAIAPATPVQKHVRKSRSMYTSWSLGIGSSRDLHPGTSMNSRRSSSQKARESRVPVTSISEDDTIPQTFSTAPASEEIAAARDRVLQDFQKSRLITRPSFVFTPFKKRQDRQPQHQSSATSEGSPPHETPPLSISGPAIASSKPEEKRSFSGSLKTKLKKVFRKTSKPTISLPVQQVDASRVYFSNSIQATPREASPGTATVAPMDYFTTTEPPRQVSRQRILSDVSHHSRESGDDHDATDISKSRVTSWTNSSATTSINGRDPKRLSIIPETEPTCERKRSAASLLGRGTFRKPVNTSPVAKGPDAFDVFSALKSRLEKAGLDSNLDPNLLTSGNQTLHEKTERAMLPSQVRNTSGASSRVSRATKATIRSVTPDAFGKSRSKERRGGGHQQFDDQDDSGRGSPDDDDSGLVLPRIRLQRAAKATISTPEQMARRKCKLESRWQSQLNQGHSPVFSRNLKRAMAGVNPYELTRLDSSPSPSKSIEAPPRTSSRKPQQPVDMLNPSWPSRADIMSPSVYSRDSTGESPVRKESDGSNCAPGTVVIVSSHSAKSYTLGSSPKKDATIGTVRSSKDWKKWLSKEVSELDLSQDFDMSMTEEWLLKPVGHQREHAEIVGVGDGDDEVVIFKSRPASHNYPNTRPERLTLIEPKAGPSNQPEAGDMKSGDHVTSASTGTPPSGAEGQVGLRGVKSSTHKSEVLAEKDNGATQVESKNSNSPSSSGSGCNTDRESEQASSPEPEEKIPVSSLADQTIRTSRSCQSVRRSAGRSHSSLAHYTTSAEDPVMQQQQRPAVVPTYSSAEPAAAPAANPPFRYRPAGTITPFSRPRSAFDLRQQRSGDQLRFPTAAQQRSSPTTTAIPIAAGSSLLLPPPPPHHHHPHHLRRKPVAVGSHRGRGRLTPSPTPNPSMEGDTVQMIMQGPYSSKSSNSEAAAAPSTPPWIPPPPPSLGRASLSRPQQWNHLHNPGSPSPLSLANSPYHHHPHHQHHHHHHQQHQLLTTRQSTPALRVTPKPSSMRLYQQSYGFKENASPAAMTPPVTAAAKEFFFGAAAAENGGAGAGAGAAAESDRGTPSPGQLLAEKWLSTRQQQQQQKPSAAVTPPSEKGVGSGNGAKGESGRGAGGMSGSVAFL